MNIAEVRKKYPQYNDLSDVELANGLHQKHYSDMDFSKFSEKIGLVQPQEKVRFLKQGGPSQFSDEPDFGEMPVGEPRHMGKAMAAPFEPMAQLLRSPGAVTEAGLGARPEALEEKGASILDFAGHTFRGVLREGGSCAIDCVDPIDNL